MMNSSGKPKAQIQTKINLFLSSPTKKPSLVEVNGEKIETGEKRGRDNEQEKKGNTQQFLL